MAVVVFCYRFQLFPALRVLHEVLFLFQHLRKTADGLKVQGRFGGIPRAQAVRGRG